ncbi:hypothetical protein gpAD87_24160 [Paenibacillus sp. AD87]|nr:hypothetical protein gpAD87_24160 [Paenibacillus sp. AD87]
MLIHKAIVVMLEGLDNRINQVGCKIRCILCCPSQLIRLITCISQNLSCRNHAIQRNPGMNVRIIKVNIFARVHLRPDPNDTHRIGPIRLIS